MITILNFRGRRGRVEGEGKKAFTYSFRNENINIIAQ